MFRTKFHRDRTVTIWNVYTQSWERTARPSADMLATLSHKERERVIRHCGLAQSGLAMSR